MISVAAASLKARFRHRLPSRHGPNDLETVADTLGLKRFALFGDIAGRCSSRSPTRHVTPHRVSHLVLLGAYAQRQASVVTLIHCSSETKRQILR